MASRRNTDHSKRMSKHCTDIIWKTKHGRLGSVSRQRLKFRCKTKLRFLPKQCSAIWKSYKWCVNFSTSKSWSVQINSPEWIQKKRSAYLMPTFFDQTSQILKYQVVASALISRTCLVMSTMTVREVFGGVDGHPTTGRENIESTRFPHPLSWTNSEEKTWSSLDTLRLDHLFSKRQQAVSQMTSKYRFMWNGQLIRSSIASQFTLDQAQVHASHTLLD